MRDESGGFSRPPSGVRRDPVDDLGASVAVTDPMVGLDSSHVLQPGDLLDGRYRLERQLNQRGRVALWRGEDVVLVRPVAVRALVTSGPVELDEDAQRLLDAAVRSGRLVHGGAASTYDATTTEVSGATVAFVVSEWAAGTSLLELLHEEPLSPERAAGLMLAVARVIAAAHAHGVAHGDLHPGDIVITPHGLVKVLDLEIHNAVEEQPAAGRGRDELRHRDVEGLGALLYACLTGRWPLGAGRGLPAAATDPNGRLCTPRQLRARVPRQLDTLTMRLLQPTVSGSAEELSAEAVVVALESVSGHFAVDSEPLDDTAPVPVVSVPSGRRRRRRWSLLAATLVVVLAAAAALTGLALGRLPGFGAKHSSSSNPQGATGPALMPAAVMDFDPGGDGHEDPDRVRFAYDNDPTTSWSTEWYQSATFGNLKKGVGLKIDFGHPVDIALAELQFVENGVSVQLRATDSDSNDPDAYRMVASADNAPPDIRLTPTSGAHRFWLIWITKLPSTGPNRFSADLAEMRFTGPS